MSQPVPLDELRQADLQRQHLDEIARNSRHEDLGAQARRILATLTPALRPATAHEYSQWLAGYRQNGGEVTHFYGYNTPSHWYTATTNIEIEGPLYGANAPSIIVPARFTVTRPQGIGHTNLFLMDGYTAQPHWVPCYADTEDLAHAEGASL